MADKKTKVKALVILRDKDGKKVSIGEYVEVSKETSDVLIKNKQAELAEVKKG